MNRIKYMKKFKKSGHELINDSSHVNRLNDYMNQVMYPETK